MSVSQREYDSSSGGDMDQLLFIVREELVDGYVCWHYVYTGGVLMVSVDSPLGEASRQLATTHYFYGDWRERYSSWDCPGEWSIYWEDSTAIAARGL